jgi:hypothetical protein
MIKNISILQGAPGFSIMKHHFLKSYPRARPKSGRGDGKDRFKKNWYAFIGAFGKISSILTV